MKGMYRNKKMEKEGKTKKQGHNCFLRGKSCQVESHYQDSMTAGAPKASKCYYCLYRGCQVESAAVIQGRRCFCQVREYKTRQ